MLLFRGILPNINVASNAAILLKALMYHVKTSLCTPAYRHAESRQDQHYHGPPTSTQAS